MKQQMKFTIENQKENRISRTTEQTVKHSLYSNNEVSIIGLGDSYKVWHKFGSRVTMLAEGLSLNEAIDVANRFINNI